jgi:hypothetical protein
VGKKSRLAAAVAAAGACALLAACSPVKMGAAAIVGNDRITSSSLDSQVSNLQQEVSECGNSQSPTLKPEMPKAVLNWLVNFAVRDRTAQDLGITTGSADVTDALNLLYHGNSAGYTSKQQLVAAAECVPPDQLAEFGQWFSVELTYFKQHNNGQLPTDQATFDKLVAGLATADCRSAKALGVQINPQYGQLSYSSSSGIYVMSGPDTLSAAGGPASPAASPFALAC